MQEGRAAVRDRLAVSRVKSCAASPCEADLIKGLIAIGREFAVHPLTRDAQLAAWRRFILWQIRSCLHDEVIVPWIGGQRFALRRGMTGATGNLYLGLHEFMSMGLVLHFLRAGDLFIDAGANVGSYTVLASGICGARTLAIEAGAIAGDRLARNVEVNGLEQLVTISLVALGPIDGTAHFTRSLDAMNKVVDTAGPDTVAVAQRTLDGVVADEQPAALKLDVEGYEEEVLRGGSQVIAKPSLKLIELETTTPNILALFERHGFERAFYDPFTRILQRTPNALAYADGKWAPSNLFYVRDWEFVQQRIANAKPIVVLGRTL